jgi:hypothetical protein
MEDIELIIPILVPIITDEYKLAKTKRERSPTLANIESTPKYNKNDSNEIEKIDKFEGIYNKYIKFIYRDNTETYRIKKWNSYQFVVESIKYSLGIRSPRCYCLDLGKNKYLGYEVYRDPKDNKIWEETLFDCYEKKDWTDKFLSEYKTIIFFRYLMGFKTTSRSLRIGYNGDEYFPISYSETIQAKGDNRSGKDFYITSTKIYNDEKDEFKAKIFIDPNTELKKLCKSNKLKVTRKEIMDFLNKLKDTIRKADPAYLWLINSINLKISGILDV